MANFENLPGTFLDLRDGGLTIYPEERTPRLLILGTASQGVSFPYRVTRVQLAEAEFGISGTLMRGLYEAKMAAPANVYLMRICAKPAKLEHVGDSTGQGGITIQTFEKDAQAGDRVKIYWNDTAKVLKCWDTDNRLVYDSSTGYSTGYVAVVGSALNTTGADIGSENNPVVMSAVTATGTVYTAGSDGLNPTLMELYEGLEEAYEALESFDADMVVPMGCHLDDPNIADDSTVVAQVTNEAVGTGDGSKKVFDLDRAKVVETTLVVKVDNVVTPVTLKRGTGTGGVDQIEFATAPEDAKPITASYSYMVKDALLYFRKYEQNGITKFEWHTSKTRQVGGETYNYHEVNFAHQLALFCHLLSTNDNMALGCIGVRPPAGITPLSLAQWVGKPPVKDSDGSITVDGTGLLGNKFMAGSTQRQHPGFWYTSSGYLDEPTTYDVKTTPDIGRYLSIVASPCSFFNAASPVAGVSYMASAAALYGGFVVTLPTNQAPTNKVLRGAVLPFNLSKLKLDQLISLGYVMFANRDNGVVVVDAPTAATSASDYRRLSTIRIVTELVDRLRQALNPFIGNATTQTERAAMQTVAEELGQKMVSEGKIQRAEFLVSATPAQQVQGEATVEVVVVPAFELRQIHLVIALSAT